MRVQLPYTKAVVEYLSIDFFLHKIVMNENFSFIRVNHGIIDAIASTYENLDEFFSDFKSKNCLEITRKILDGSFYRKDHSEIHYKSPNTLEKNTNIAWQYHGESKTQGQKLLSFFNLLCNYDSDDKLLVGISPDVGLDLAWGRWDENDPRQKKRNLIVSKIVNSFDKPFYHSGVFKHYSVTNEIEHLFKVLNEEKFQVVFIGPSYLKFLPRRFDIHNFHHIETPFQGAIDKYDEYIDRLISIEGEKRIFLNSSGHIISAYLREKTKGTNFFQIDIGKSLDWCIKDSEVPLSDWPPAFRCWVTLKENHIRKYIEKLRNE